MKAFVYKMDGDRETLEGRVSPEYKTRSTLERYYLSKLPAGRWRVHAFYNWENRFNRAHDFCFDYWSFNK